MSETNNFSPNRQISGILSPTLPNEGNTLLSWVNSQLLSRMWWCTWMKRQWPMPIMGNPYCRWQPLNQLKNQRSDLFLKCRRSQLHHFSVAEGFLWMSHNTIGMSRVLWVVMKKLGSTLLPWHKDCMTLDTEQKNVKWNCGTSWVEHWIYLEWNA